MQGSRAKLDDMLRVRRLRLIQSPSTTLEHRGGNIFLEGRQNWTGSSFPPEGGYCPGLTPFYLSYDRFFGPCKLDPGTPIQIHYGQSCLRTGRFFQAFVSHSQEGVTDKHT